MASNSMEDLKNKLIGYIEDAYALENQIVEVLEKQVQLTANVPELNGRIKQHLAETQVQRRRMEERLEAYGRSPSAIKGVVSNIMGNVAGVTAGMRGDALSRAIRDDYVTEHLEIAGYTLLIDTARLVGDEETVKAAQLTLKEEIAMQEWCAQNLDTALLLDFKAENIDISATQRETIGQGPKLHVTFEPTIGQTQKS